MDPALGLMAIKLGKLAFDAWELNQIDDEAGAKAKLAEAREVYDQGVAAWEGRNSAKPE